MSNLSTLLDRYKALVVFDTETSGLDFDNDQIIELAALRVERTATGGLRIAGKMDTFIRLPEGKQLPENIVTLTGITDRLLETEGAVYDMEPHRYAPPGLRLWCGCTVETADVVAATPWLEWAFQTAVGELAG